MHIYIHICLSILSAQACLWCMNICMHVYECPPTYLSIHSTLCIFVSVFLYIHTCMFVSKYWSTLSTHACLCMCMDVPTYLTVHPFHSMYVCIYAYNMHVYVYIICMYVYMHILIHAFYLHMHVCICVYMYMDVYGCIYLLTCLSIPGIYPFCSSNYLPTYLPICPSILLYRLVVLLLVLSLINVEHVLSGAMRI